MFVCFVLEYLAQPVAALAALDGLLKPGGSMPVIEGDHGSGCFHPDSQAAAAAIRCQVELQRQAGGNALIGRQVYVRRRALAAGLAEPASFDASVRDLHRTTEADGVFCYTFFKGVGTKRRA